MTYNGWTNYETWNVALWIGNDEGLYRCQQEIVEQHVQSDKHINGEVVGQFFDEFMDRTTPDLKGTPSYELEPINFDEIAEHWETERLEMQD